MTDTVEKIKVSIKQLNEWLDESVKNGTAFIEIGNGLFFEDDSDNQIFIGHTAHWENDGYITHYSGLEATEAKLEHWKDGSEEIIDCDPNELTEFISDYLYNYELDNYITSDEYEADMADRYYTAETERDTEQWLNSQAI